MSDSNLCLIDDLTIDFDRRKVYDGSQKEIALSALSFDTLRALMDASPAVLTNDELINRAWRGSVVSDETVTQRIRLLRKALGDDRRQPRYIETIRNVGYRLIPPVAPATSSTQSGSAPFVLIAGALAVLAVGVAIWFSQKEQLPAPIENSLSTIQLGGVTATELADEARRLTDQRNPDSLRHAIDLYEQALVIEPGNANITASLSLALSRSVAWYGDTYDLALRAERLANEAMTEGAFFAAEFALAFSLDAQGKVEPAKAAYERAVALDPEHHGARASLAYLLQVQGKLVEALSHNMIAFKQAPRGTLDTQIASCLRLLGFYSVASEWLDRTDRLDPDSAHAAPSRALDLLTQRKYAEADSVIRKALARGVEQVELYEYMTVLALLENDFALAMSALNSAPDSIAHRGPFEIWRRVVAAIADGAIEPAIELSESILADVNAGETWPGNFLYIAILEAAAQRNDNAIAALHLLNEAGYRDYLWLQILPPFIRLRDEPEFQAVITSMRDDVARQRAQVLTADWLPSELRVTDAETTSP